MGLALIAALFFALPNALERGVKNPFEDGIWVEEPWGVPVIDRGPKGAWDCLAVDNPFVLPDGDRLLCFYEGENEAHNEQTGLAVSEDGLRWRKWPHNPIVKVGPKGAWDSIRAKIPVAVKWRGRYFVLYSGWDGRRKQIGLAVSRDLVRWEKWPENPVIPCVPGTWEANVSTCPAIVKRGDLFCLIYRGMKRLYVEQKLGLAVSRDLVHWERHPRNPLLPDIASFALVEVPGGFVGMAQEPEPRHYYFSRDLVRWERAGFVYFSAEGVDTPSQPFRWGDDWIVLYEKGGDRIYRARFERRSHQLPFFDDFRSPLRGGLPKWAPLVGGWELRGGRYWQTGGGDLWQRAIAWAEPADDFALSVEVRGESKSGWVGVVFRHRRGFYSFALAMDGRNVARLFKSPTGERFDVAWRKDARFDARPGRAYKIEVVMRGRKITCKVDGRIVLEVEDPEPLPPGRAGLFATAARASFDNFWLQKLSG